MEVYLGPLTMSKTTLDPCHSGNSKVQAEQRTRRHNDITRKVLYISKYLQESSCPNIGRQWIIGTTWLMTPKGWQSKKTIRRSGATQNPTSRQERNRTVEHKKAKTETETGTAFWIGQGYGAHRARPRRLATQMNFSCRPYPLIPEHHVVEYAISQASGVKRGTF